MQAEHDESDVRHAPYDEDLTDLAAHVIGDLGLHLRPHAGHQVAVARQIAHEPADDLVLVLEEEEDQHGHQDQENQQPHHAGNRSQRPAQQPLPPGTQLAAQVGENSLQLRLGQDLRILLLQFCHHRLPLVDVPGQGLDQLAQLPGEHGDQAEQQEKQHGQEQHEHQDHCQQAVHAKPHQLIDKRLQQVGEDDGRENRGQHLAEAEHDERPDQQEEAENHHLRVRECALEPGLKHVHQLDPC